MQHFEEKEMFQECGGKPFTDFHSPHSSNSIPIDSYLLLLMQESKEPCSHLAKTHRDHIGYSS